MLHGFTWVLLMAGARLAGADELCEGDVCSAMTLLQMDRSFTSHTAGDSAAVPVLKPTEEADTWPSCFEGLFFGLFSALSLPIGALLGIYMSPVDPVCVGKWLAFGAGALIYAVATDLFGEKLFELAGTTESANGVTCGAVCLTLFRQMSYQITSSFLGAVAYLALSNYVGLDHAVHQQPGAADKLPGISNHEAGALNEHGAADQQLGISNLQAGAPEPPEGQVKQASGTADQARAIALSMWIGMMLDGIPEGLMMGFMTKTGGLSFSLVISILVANFPEAFSGSSLLAEHKMPATQIFTLWMTLFVATGFFAMIGGFLIDLSRSNATSLAEEDCSAVLKGFTGGAMLAMGATAMLPTAFKEAGTAAGFYFVFGFATSLLISALGFRFGTPVDLLHRVALIDGTWLAIR